MLDAKELHGHWAIVSWAQNYDDGRKAYPLGQSLGGFLQYGPDGRMACMIADTSRPRQSGGQFTSPDAELLTACRGFFAYAGTYTIDGDTVLHQVDISLFPNWEGGVQKRHVALADGQLTIVARLEEGTSEARTAMLTWQKPDSPRL